MKKSLIIFLLAGCVALVSAQDRTAGDTLNLQKELKTLHSTVRALQRSQAAQKKTFNILASRLDSLQGAVHATQVQAAQTIDSVSQLSRMQTASTERIDAIELSLEMRTVLLILALVAIAALSLVIFFTLKKAIAESSEILQQQILKSGPVELKRHDTKQASALIVEPLQKKTTITLPIEPELFEAAVTKAAAAESPVPPRSELHVAIANMIEPPDVPAPTPAPAVETQAAASKEKRTKHAAQCQGVTKTGARCKRKPVAGTHFCTQHTKK